MNRSPVRSIKFIIATLISALVHTTVTAQSAPVEARVTSATANPLLIRNARSFVLRKGDKLALGDEIDTAAGGRVVIGLSDGSIITIAPGARVVLRDFRQASSLRELVDVIIGRIRVKVYKFGGRPNPYRINSPTASIAVRGTEFIVSVQLSGETEVAVTEGLVEVISRFDANQKRLVEPGRSVIVRASGDISRHLPGPGSELEARIKPLSDQKNFYYRDSEYAVTYAYNIYNRNITERTLNNAPARFAAFADAHFDSLLNPAYATEFKRADGRVYLAPSLSRPLAQIIGVDRAQFNAPHRFDHTLSLQASYFTPLGNRWVLGGGIAKHDTDLESAAINALRHQFPNYSVTFSFKGAVNATTVNGALVAARSFGARERTSLGFKLERLESRAVLTTAEEVVERLDDYPEVFTGHRFNKADARSRRTTATVGLTHTFARGDQLGLSYSYGVARGGFHYQTDERDFLFNNPVTGKQIAAQAAEAALLLRGPLTRQLFYGLEASWLNESITDDYQYKRSVMAQHRRAQRPRVGGGLGFALRPRTMLSLDFSWAKQRVQENKVEVLADNYFPDSQRYSATFINGHLGLQTDLGRRFLAGASATRVYEKRYFELFDLHENRRATFSTFAFGWRARPGWIAQYLFSTDYGRRGPSHTLLLRYDFNFGKEK